MDRFVWFVLLVVISHLVTEFTRVTGYNRGPRQDVVTVNDSSIQHIKVPNLVIYPGQEYGLYGQPNQQYYRGNKLYNNYANNTDTHNNFLSSSFNQFIGYTQNAQQQPPTTDNNKLLSVSSERREMKTFSFRPLIDSIFEIPISALRAVNNLLTRLAGGYLKPQKQQQQEQQQQQFVPQQEKEKPTKYFAYLNDNHHQPTYPYYGMQRSANALPKPKTQFEMLNHKRPSSTEEAVKSTVDTNSPIRKYSLSVGVPR